MTAIKVGDDTLLLDCGLWIEKVVEIEDGNISQMNVIELMEREAVPNDLDFFEKHGRSVKAIVCTHAHLDHCGAIPILANKYKAPIIATPFTIEVIQSLYEERGTEIPRFIRLNPGSSYRIASFLIRFLHVTHSTPQTVMASIESKEGEILYANDFKFDDHPLLGKKTDYSGISERKGAKLLISDSTRIEREGRCYSESLVKEMLSDILEWVGSEEKLLILTTFSSHLARIRMMVEMLRKVKREPLLLGRSLATYIECAERINLINFPKYCKVLGEKEKIDKALKQVSHDPGKYAIICTGNQGEPRSVLFRIARDETPLKLSNEDVVIFCSEVIPSPINRAHRADLERRLRNKGVRIFKDVHVSGHAFREDHRWLLKTIGPKYYLPTHGGLDKIVHAVELAHELGYELNKDVFVLQNFQELKI
ncbi:MAG: MBL fold metallo-hydrolase [Candidatus Nanoarchaeia archaeon]|nr:MBL fold metallo-hydrolase [Candidatus Haiyanarchaeum thermophilum]MCW1306366.1 MBL fold metallo-hydrolase [Candidatus Haiyanarchaeum thermophilum]